MAYLRIDIDYESKLATLPAHKRLMNRLYREEMEYHKASILPRHFEDVPETRPHGAYGYLPRSKKWKKRKEREGKDPNRPLVYRGLMRRIVLKESVVRATKDHGTLTAKNYYDMREQRRKEVEAFSNREVERLVARFGKKYSTLVRTPEYARKRAERLKKS
jgi:hypothetical protein